MKPIELITLDHEIKPSDRDCCAKCENSSDYNDYSVCLLNCISDSEGGCSACLDEWCFQHRGFAVPKIYDPYNNICAGDNFKRREK